ncbi:ABC transporter ATP-binding protein [Shouchella shacheensis]|uniref:ABC transporter ATP-binding protein n=1 Tax=Shouchella shacheensis TaxID=1649580 RepID=UPI00074038A3|nr:ABC transporter ATP-binding protein [Shouchella shacheensis]
MSLKQQLKAPFQYRNIDWRHSQAPAPQSESSAPRHPHAARAGGKKEKVRDWKEAVGRIWRYLARSKAGLTLVVFLVFASSTFMLLGPLLIGIIIDDYILAGAIDGLAMMLLFLLLSYLGLSLATFFQNFWMVSIAQRAVYAIRRDLFAHLQKLPVRFFDQRQHGDVMSRVTNDIENISGTLNSSIVQILSSVITFVGILTVMLVLSPVLTLLTILVIPIMFYGLKWITKRTRVFFKDQQRALGILNGYSEETIAGQTMVKTFSREGPIIEDFEAKNASLKTAGFWAQTYSGFIPKLMNVLNNMSFTVIAGVGGLLAVNQVAGVTVGIMVVFVEYSRQFTRPLSDLANQFNMLLSALAGAERVFDIMDEEPERDREGARSVESIKGDVTLSNVSFSYEDEPTLQDISFQAKAGETVAFVGPTGAGKTTIINLLAGFYEPSAGTIEMDGKDMRQLRREDLRKQMGVVLQDSFLFQGSIRENIRYGRLAASDGEVEEAAKLANAHGFITHLKNGYETRLGQDGSGISQGQRQLLSIARALLASPSILILDEATSSIDTVTEMKIQEALGRLMEGRTSFVIAHRLNTIEAADQILVLQDGRLTEQGNHQQLMQRGGFYYELQQTNQMAGEKADEA